MARQQGRVAGLVFFGYDGAMKTAPGKQWIHDLIEEMYRHCEAKRTCDGCTVCCTVFGVKDETIYKLRYSRCPHLCENGCGIYANRPKVCKHFLCGWRCGHIGGLSPDKQGILAHSKWAHWVTDRGTMPFVTHILYEVWQDAAVDNQEFIDNFAKSKGDILLCRFNQNDAMQWWFDGAMVTPRDKNHYYPQTVLDAAYASLLDWYTTCGLTRNQIDSLVSSLIHPPRRD